ncbi:hypothetical protein EXE46_13545 [Halorubrum sp. GN11_10-6_MGM]|uniref:hypothetical protein n=1 Tax=Halorubrum sp. GN11_10-6_MGM TaxID=2518112 RepID=UPI0010F48423|nr:hypothetical protein [Halorubrum sp. GN11_10-6_MGM]TKX73588.1 hypothetical protein EXE46_13545 [Halorubrum sp. GN11_10-6_MGM]
MGSRGTSLRDRIREPEYTGENRCVPCTVLNGVLAVALTAAAAVFGPVAAAVVLTASLGSIYYRGYLVPGTPELTKRYLPDRVLRVFGKAPEGPREGWEDASGARSDEVTVTTFEADRTADAAADRTADGTADGTANRTADPTGDETTAPTQADGASERTDADEPEFETVERIRDQRENAVDPVEFLLDVGVVEPTDDGADLVFEDGFAEAVESRVDSLERGDVRAETLAEMFGASPDDVAFEDRSYPAVTVLRRVRKWPGDGAFLADVASHLALVERTDRWLDVPAEQRLSILQSLRSFLASCPVCGGDVAATADTVESCCLAHEVVAIRCEDCGEHILELDPKEVSRDAESTGITP